MACFSSLKTLREFASHIFITEIWISIIEPYMWETNESLFLNISENSTGELPWIHELPLRVNSDSNSIKRLKLTLQQKKQKTYFEQGFVENCLLEKKIPIAFPPNFYHVSLPVCILIHNFNGFADITLFVLKDDSKYNYKYKLIYEPHEPFFYPPFIISQGYNLAKVLACKEPYCCREHRKKNFSSISKFYKTRFEIVTHIQTVLKYHIWEHQNDFYISFLSNAVTTAPAQKFSKSSQCKAKIRDFLQEPLMAGFLGFLCFTFYTLFCVIFMVWQICVYVKIKLKERNESKEKLTVKRLTA